MNRSQILWTLKQMTKAPSKYAKVLNWLNGMTIAQLDSLVDHIEKQPLMSYEVVPYLKTLSKTNKSIPL